MAIVNSTWEIQGWDATTMLPTGIVTNLQVVNDSVQPLAAEEKCEAFYPCDTAEPQPMPPIAPGQESTYVFKWLGYAAQTFVHLRADETLGFYLVTNNVIPDAASGVVTERSMIVQIALR